MTSHRQPGQELARIEESEPGPIARLTAQVAQLEIIVKRYLGRGEREAELERERNDFQAENRRLRAANDRLAADVEELQTDLADRVRSAAAARDDVGTTLDAQHRELAGKAYDQLQVGLAYPATLSAPDGDIEDRQRWEATVTAGMFRLLIAGLEVDKAVAERWAMVKATQREMATEIDREAAHLRDLIGKADGTQRWVYDYSPPGTTFNPALFDSFSGRSTGTVAFTIVPAYFVDSILIRKPTVYVA